MAVMTASMLMPTVALASSIRPGSSFKTKTRQPTCLVGQEEEKELWEECKVVIDETGVTHPIGKIVNVVQWTTEKKEFNAVSYTHLTLPTTPYV